MTTKAPSTVRPAADGTLEKAAYASVAGIPTLDPHDQDRLGYCVYLWLKDRRDPLPVVIRNAGARFTITDEEVINRITTSLTSQGVSI